MPYEFDPDSAVLYGSPPDVEIDAAAFALQEEDFLLTHKCRRSASCQTEREIGQIVTRGGGSTYSVEDEAHCILRVDYDQQLEYQIEATALSLQGLANHHPGAGLDDYSLAFLNGSASDLPFRFTGGTWIYLEPSQDCAAGDLAEISFKVVREFTDVVDGEEPPSIYALIAEQDATEVLAAAQTLALEDVFLEAGNLTGAFTATLYDGDPLAAGVAVSEILTLGPWTDLVAGASETQKEVRNQAEHTWASDPAERTVTHILYKRGSDNIAAPALAVPLVVPAGYGVRAPIGALGLSMNWPADVTYYTVVIGDFPAARALLLMCGGFPLPAGTLTVEAWSAYATDPSLPEWIRDTWTVPRTAVEWDLAALTVENLIALTSPNLADIDWEIAFVAVRITTLTGVWFLFSKLPVPMTVLTGNAVSFAAGEIALDLDA